MGKFGLQSNQLIKNFMVSLHSSTLGVVFFFIGKGENKESMTLIVLKSMW